MRGAAMKVGQMISMVEFDGLPRTQQDELQRRLATLRDGIPPVPFARLEKMMRKEFGVPLRQVFSDFDERAFAAARSARSIARGPSMATMWSRRSSIPGLPRRSRPTCATRCCCCRWSSG